MLQRGKKSSQISTGLIDSQGITNIQDKTHNEHDIHTHQKHAKVTQTPQQKHTTNTRRKHTNTTSQKSQHISLNDTKNSTQLHAQNKHTNNKKEPLPPTNVKKITRLEPLHLANPNQFFLCHSLLRQQFFLVSVQD